jgi:hypothetical protein
MDSFKSFKSSTTAVPKTYDGAANIQVVCVDARISKAAAACICTVAQFPKPISERRPPTEARVNPIVISFFKSNHSVQGRSKDLTSIC